MMHNLAGRWRAMASGALVLALAFFCMTVPAFAQITGAIEGTVVDQSGAVIPDAKVTIRHNRTGTQRIVHSNAQGQFSSQLLELGLYTVTVEKDGFRMTSIEADVRSAQSTRLSVGLEVGALEEVLTVEGSTTPLLDVNTSQLGTSVDARLAVALPSQGRNPVAFAALAPGTVPVTKDNPFLGTGSFNSNGSRGRANNITIDGTTSTDVSVTGTAGLINTISLDSIAEFKLISHNFSAEFGRNSGSQVQIITRGGSNELHGTVHYFHQNSAFNARDHFDTTGEATPFKRNFWGFTLGGPIRRDKTFASGHYEGLRTRGQGATRTATVLTPAEAAAITDPTSAALFAAVGAPTSATGQLSASAPNATDSVSWGIRVDQHWRDGKDILNVRYGQAPATSVTPGLTFIGTNHVNYGAGAVSAARRLTIGHTTTISPTLVNTFRFAYGRSDPSFQPFSTLPTDARFGITGFSSMGIWEGLPQGRVQNTFQWSDTISWTSGRHTIKTGGDIMWVQANSFFDAVFRPLVAFSSLANFQAGIPSSLAQRFGGSERHNVSTDFMWFGQDDVRVTPTLTLNLGLRVERSGGVKEKDNLLTNLNTGRTDPLGALGAGPLGNLDLGGFSFRANLNWAPRLGFAWNPGGGKLVIRGGTGWAYDYIFLNPITNLRFTPPFITLASLSGTAITGANSFANFMAGTAQAQTDAQSSVGVLDPTQFNFGGLAPVDQNLRNPRNTQWSLGVQYEVARDLVVKASYVGAKNDFLQSSVPINLVRADMRPAPATSLADETARLAEFTTAFSAQNGPAFGPGTNNRIDPRFNAVTQVQSRATSNFHSLQLDATKRMRGGLAWGVGYTWAHSIDDVSDVLGVLVNDSPAFQDPRDLGANRGNSQFDIRHRFTGNFLWELPWSRNFTGGAGKVLGGWAVSGIVDTRTGLPVSIFSGSRLGISDPALMGGGIIRADGNPLLLTPGAGAPALATRGPGSGFAVTQPLLGNFGTSPRNVLRLDKLFNADFAILKNTSITERVGTQFRWEMFNLFNNVNFSQYVSSLTSSTFNTYQGTATDMRQMQVSLKILF